MQALEPDSNFELLRTLLKSQQSDLQSEKITKDNRQRLL